MRGGRRVEPSLDFVGTGEILARIEARSERSMLDREEFELIETLERGTDLTVGDLARIRHLTGVALEEAPGR